jgi:hypothetical protein
VGHDLQELARFHHQPCGIFQTTNATELGGSGNQFVAAPSSMLAIAAYQFTLNAPSSTGAKVNFVALQAGLGLCPPPTTSAPDAMHGRGSESAIRQHG